MGAIFGYEGVTAVAWAGEIRGGVVAAVFRISDGVWCITIGLPGLKLICWVTLGGGEEVGM